MTIDDRDALNRIIVDYEKEFNIISYDAYATSKTPLDDLILNAKKYVNTLNISEDESNALQRIMPAYVEGLYRRKFYWNDLLEEIQDNNMFMSQIDMALKARSIMYSSMSGIAALLINPDIRTALATSLMVGVATYFSGGKSLKKHKDFKKDIVGTREYLDKLLDDFKNDLHASSAESK